MIEFDDFLLPQARIATRPKEKREEANLLSCIEDAPQNLRVKDLRVKDLPSLLKRGDVIVINDTKVLPARMLAYPVIEGENSEDKREANPPLEVTIAEKIEPALFRVFIKGKMKETTRLRFGDNKQSKQPFFARLEGRDADGLLRLRFEGLSEEGLYDRLEAEGAMPLPPYMKRSPDAQDKQDYQTLFARHRGAFAAPTAGRHLTPRLLEEMQHKGIETLFVTLHVSFGSFRPLRDVALRDVALRDVALRDADFLQPRMARESVVVSAEVWARIQACRQRGGRVLAVGTTVVRALETAALQGKLEAQQEGKQNNEGGAFCGETDLFIAEGFDFRCCDLLLTNFHQARATPLLLTCAFAGEQQVKRAYAHARAHEQYRFFSYGDACLFSRCLFARRAKG